MKGTIIDFDEIEKSGLILAEDGNRYLFEFLHSLIISMKS